jgi:hypothetical protein
MLAVGIVGIFIDVALRLAERSIGRRWGRG